MKDNNNLLSHNQWTAGEYENYPEIFYTAPMTDRICTNDYSSIGEQSIKLTKLGSPGSYARVSYNQSIINKTVTASVTIKTENATVLLILLERDGTNIIQQRNVTVPSNSFMNISVSLESTSSNTSFGIQFNNNGDVGSFIHIDNISLTVS